MNNCSIWDSISHSLSFTHLSREFSEFERLLVADLGRCFFTWDVPCCKASTQQVNKTDFQALQNSWPGIDSEAQKSLASHISSCFTVRNMSSQMNDYPTLQYTTDLHCSKGARQRTRRKEEKEKNHGTKLSGASCFAICHCHGCNLWYVETTFLWSAGDNPRLFPFASPW